MRRLKTFEIQLGRHYQDISEFGEREIYHLCQVEMTPNGQLRYCLMGLRSHNRYIEPTTSIIEVFGKRQSDFVQVVGNILLRA